MLNFSFNTAPLCNTTDSVFYKCYIFDSTEQILAEKPNTTRWNEVKNMNII